MGTLLGQAPEPTLHNQGRQMRADISAIDALAKAFARSASSPLQVPELPALLQGSPRLGFRIRLPTSGPRHWEAEVATIAPRLSSTSTITDASPPSTPTPAPVWIS